MNRIKTINSFFIAILYINFTISCNTSKKVALIEKTSINKWEKAVLNIESIRDKYSLIEIEKYLNEKKVKNKNYSDSDYNKEFKLLREETETITGSAIYLEDSGYKYLITAKHVVYDKNATLRHILFTREDKNMRSHEFFEKLNTNIAVRTPLSLFKKNSINFFEIPNVNQDSATRPFKFSTDDLDIAIISLQSQKTFEIRKILEADGYIPIHISDIDIEENHQVGDELTAIGYPSLSMVTSFAVTKDIKQQIVLPLVTFGRTAMTDSVLTYIVADITINPGNSGGPILRNNKLIGIASKQMIVNLVADGDIDSGDPFSHLKSGSPLAQIIKAKYLISALEKLKEIENSPAFLLQKNIR